MRTRAVLALGVLLAAITAGCAKTAAGDTGVATAQSTGPKASSSAATRTGPDPDAMLKYSKCMREHGLDWFPDPNTDGQLQVQNPPGEPDSKTKAAEEACRSLLPDGGEQKDKTSPEEIERAQQMAKCMRANGVPNFPDPGPNGEIALDADKLGTGPGDATFDAAEKACSKYLPPNASRKGSTQQEANA
ncbi:hypothetical protein [Actinoplanes regularis]|uniref:hypothetical protein n=1 Tax=Actinoplanes regularis TaxID=52697 RepID=UPI0024A4757C|nr:hypothetical protein [Actinoplanes regularis]GLW30857.1 hypothetical protein Areg01_37970 [Actinoplanes regularis]